MPAGRNSRREPRRAGAVALDADDGDRPFRNEQGDLGAREVTAAVTVGPAPARLPVSALMSLQRTAGNSATGFAVQRWRLPPELACEEVVPYMDASSPYAPEWAQTASTHSFEGSPRVRHDRGDDGTVTSTAKGHPRLRVTVQSPVDRPQWNPSRRPNRRAEVAAFQAMRRTLDAHEAEHQRIARTNNTELQNRYRAVDLSVTGDSEAANIAELTSQLQSDQQGWADWAQEQQSAIDPFRGAVFECPETPDQPEGD